MLEEVVWEDDLMYEVKTRQKKCMRVGCSAIEDERKFASCSKCGSKFCSRDCLVNDWKNGHHKAICGELAVLRDCGWTHEKKRQVLMNGVFGRIRMYASPFYIHHKEIQHANRGALFIQSPNQLEDFILYPSVNRYGEQIDRQVVLTYITTTEFDQEVVPSDFEFALARSALHKAIDKAAQNCDHSIPVLAKFGCGYIAVIILRLVPDINICRALAVDYQGLQTVQLNINDDS
mmetsp:Transcript_17449/g.26246  ORF Transcript_17449/g.26246 Transcript_17449/m.26246 type:complete len:233 (+) Transcript_17449:38-736(+)